MTESKTRSHLVGVFGNTVATAPSYDEKSFVLTTHGFQSIPPKSEAKTLVMVENCDTLVMAKKLVDFGLHPLVLNMASFKQPGGGVLWGARAQEEELFRRSNYFRALSWNNFYPLGMREFVISPQVTVYKDENYNPMTPFKVDMIAVAAIQDPNLIDGQYKTEDLEITREKIESIFTYALSRNDSLVLSALGCGAYNNPPHIVAEIFKEFAVKYKSCFKIIAFGVLGEPNFSIFKEILGPLET